MLARNPAHSEHREANSATEKSDKRLARFG